MRETTLSEGNSKSLTGVLGSPNNSVVTLELISFDANGTPTITIKEHVHDGHPQRHRIFLREPEVYKAITRKGHRRYFMMVATEIDPVRKRLKLAWQPVAVKEPTWHF